MEKRKSNRLLCFLLAGILTISAGAFVSSIQAEAKSKTGTLYITGVQKYGYAQQVLKLMNKERKKRGLGVVKMDKGLTKSAVTRSAELTVYIPTDSRHTRPNGKANTSINGKINYEICAEGYPSPAEVVDGWMHSPTHKKGILLANAKSAGIGCVQVGNVMYWTVDFSASKAKSVVKTKSDKKTTQKITALNKHLKASCFKIEELDYDYFEVGDSCNAVVSFKGKSKYNKMFYPVPTNAKTYKWSSSNPSVASVDSKGKIQAKKVGITTITAKLKNGTKIKKTVKIQVVAYED